MKEAKATQCFCGCGSRVQNPRLVVTNTNGWELSDELAEWTKLEIFASRTGLDLSGGDLADNIERGQQLWIDLRDALHAGELADRDDEKTAVVWRKHAKKARRKLRKQFRRDGVDPFDMPGVTAAELTEWITLGREPAWAAEFDQTDDPGDSGEDAQDGSLDPVAENLSLLLGTSVGGGDKSWIYWVGTTLIDFGIRAFREMEALTYEGEEPGQPLFPEMSRLVADPFATYKAARFLGASFPAVSIQLYELEEERWEGYGIEEWRGLDRSLHAEVFQSLCDAWDLPEDQIVYLTQTAASGFASKDATERDFMAFTRYTSMVIQQAYLLNLDESDYEEPPWHEYTRPSGAVFMLFVSYLRGYMRDLRHYTEEVTYRSQED
jgi:hypothetical protein